jgi:glycosyltransferase involved in cell wall biosynthesis
MPEILQGGGVYFNPEDPVSIFEAVKSIVDNKSLRTKIARIALERSRFFSWRRCAEETWRYLGQIKSSYAKQTHD